MRLVARLAKHRICRATTLTLIGLLAVTVPFCACPAVHAAERHARAHDCCPGTAAPTIPQHGREPSRGHQADCRHCSHGVAAETAVGTIDMAVTGFTVLVLPAYAPVIWRAAIVDLLELALPPSPPGSLLYQFCILRI